MTRIKINDIPEDKKISREELRTIMGGGSIPGMFETGQTSMYDPQIAAAAYIKKPWRQYDPSQTDPSKLMK